MSASQSLSKQLAAKVIYAAMQVLKDKGGEAAARDVIADVEKRVELDDWARATYEKSGYTRWISILQFYTIGPQKAGFLVKRKGIWYLTPEGEEALAHGEAEFFVKINQGYKDWRDANPKDAATEAVAESNSALEQATVEDIESAPELTIERAMEVANDGLQQQIRSLDPYKFQDLVAALLKGMGYYISFNAPKGKDGGIDVIAYQDPLGINAPRIKVQCKHRQNAASVDEVRQLMGLLHDGDVGIFVSSGGFTSDSKTTARSSAKHVELIDMTRLIDLWQELYHKLTDEDKDLLRLKPVFFYEPPNV